MKHAFYSEKKSLYSEKKSLYSEKKSLYSEKKSFYAHLAETEVVEQELENLVLSEHEKKDLMKHVHASIHYTVLDVVLSELPEDHKKKFVELVRENDHEKIWEHVKNNSLQIEGKIRDGIKILVSEFLDEIKKVKE